MNVEIQKHMIYICRSWLALFFQFKLTPRTLLCVFVVFVSITQFRLVKLAPRNALSDKSAVLSKINFVILILVILINSCLVWKISCLVTYKRLVMGLPQSSLYWCTIISTANASNEVQCANLNWTDSIKFLCPWSLISRKTCIFCLP